ncbi:MAG TPA: hypothetical protein VMU67_01165 [Steroidobacteraceae bacterium]|nr:hypothetical protein [Steroidobacteraceae bacterium]
MRVAGWAVRTWRIAAGSGGALCALIAAAALVTLVNEPSADETGAHPATVTAQPPLEAEPAAPSGTAHPSRLRRCDSAARTKHLHGSARDAFIQSCMGVRRAAPPARTAASVSAARAPPPHSGSGH